MTCWNPSPSVSQDQRFDISKPFQSLSKWEYWILWSNTIAESLFTKSTKSKIRIWQSMQLLFGTLDFLYLPTSDRHSPKESWERHRRITNWCFESKKKAKHNQWKIHENPSFAVQVFMGFVRDFMGFLRCFYGFPISRFWGIYGILWEEYGILWEEYGILWVEYGISQLLVPKKPVEALRPWKKSINLTKWTIPNTHQSTRFVLLDPKNTQRVRDQTTPVIWQVQIGTWPKIGHHLLQAGIFEKAFQIFI